MWQPFAQYIQLVKLWESKSSSQVYFQVSHGCVSYQKHQAGPLENVFETFYAFFFSFFWRVIGNVTE